MNQFKTTEDLYRDLTQFLPHNHYIQRYHSCDNIDIIELSSKGNPRCFLRIRVNEFGRRFSRYFQIGYAKANTMADSWRLYINERSA
jgi:hypothetical protein